MSSPAGAVPRADPAAQGSRWRRTQCRRRRRHPICGVRVCSVHRRRPWSRSLKVGRVVGHEVFRVEVQDLAQPHLARGRVDAFQREVHARLADAPGEGTDDLVLEPVHRHHLPADRQLAQVEERDLVEAGVRGRDTAGHHVEHRQRVAGVDHLGELRSLSTLHAAACFSQRGIGHVTQVAVQVGPVLRQGLEVDLAALG